MARPKMGDVLGRVKAPLPQAPKPEPMQADVPVAAEPVAMIDPIPEAAPEQDLAAASSRQPEHGRTRTRSHVEKEASARETRPATVPKGYNVRPPRIEKPHQSVYADPAVFKVIRQIAMAEDIKPQDLYREGLRHVLNRRGYNFDKLDKGEI